MRRYRQFKKKELKFSMKKIALVITQPSSQAVNWYLANRETGKNSAAAPASLHSLHGPWAPPTQKRLIKEK